MEDRISYEELMVLSPEDRERLRKFVNHKLSKLCCNCTPSMKIRGSDNLCLDCRKEYWDGQVVMAMSKVEEIEELIQKRDEIQPPDSKDN